MRSEPDDELQALRERAYGLKADISDDVAAIRRLLELELREQPLTPVAGDVQGDNPAVVSQEPALPSEVIDAPTKAPSRAKPRWRMPVIWICSVLVAIIATALVSEAVIQRGQVDPYDVGATQVARLSVELGAEIPGSFTAGGALATQAFPEFHGLQILVSPDGSLLGQNSDECLFLMRSDVYAAATADSYSGPISSGCAANNFPAVVTWKVTRDMPEELLRNYTEGTALQFVFDGGSDVVVFSSTD